MKCLKIFFAIIVFTLSNNTFAQYDPGATLSLGMGHGQNALSQSVMSNAFSNSKSAGTKKVDNADYLYLGFSHYRGFEELLVKQVVAQQKNVDKGKLRSFLNSSRTMHHFDTRARALGLKETYISDLLATGIAWNWEMYHQKKPKNEKVVQLRNAIRTNIAKDGVRNQIGKLSETDKRNWLLSFMYNHSMLAQQIKNTGKLNATHKQQLQITAKQAGVPNIALVSLD